MGVMDFIRSGVKEMMLARPDDKKHLIVWKHPENTIPAYSQLTVAADEAVVFFRDGANVGTLRTAGIGQRHTLTTGNIPFLSRFVDSFTGGNIFKTDLFFVTMRPLRENFGGELGMIEDPALGIAATPRIFGEFSFQITNPEQFILKYTGIRRVDSNEEVLKWIRGILLNGVRQTVARTLDGFAQESDPPQKGLLNLLSLQNELAQRFVQESPALGEIGIQMIGVGGFNINLNEDEYAELKEAQAELGKAKRAITQKKREAAARQFELDQQYQQDSRYVKDLAGGSYQGYAAGQAMIGAGKGMAQGGGEGGGGPMMGGAGLGIGFAMAQQMQQGMQQPQPVQPAGKPGGNVTCQQCSATVPAGKFCAECGANLAPRPRFCPGCGVQASGTGRFCAECGTAFPQ